MGYLHEKLGFILRLGLMMLLLAAQGLTFAHDLDHFQEGDGSICAVCPIPNGLGAPLPVTQTMSDMALCHVAPSERPTTIDPRTCWSPRSSRAPPRSI